MLVNSHKLSRNFDFQNKQQDDKQYQENDYEFLQHVHSIYQKKISNMRTIFNQCEVSEELCEEIGGYARVHAEANIFNSNSAIDFWTIKQKNLQHCTCGCKRAVGQKFSVFADEQKLSFLGPGVILFFFFLRYIKIGICMMLISFGLFSIVSNVLSPEVISFDTCLHKTDIEKYLCQLNAISTFNLKSSSALRMFQLILGAFVITIWFMGLKLIEFLGEKKNEEVDNLLDSASDYTIRIENLPFCSVTEKQIIDLVTELWDTDQMQEPQGITKHEKIKLKSIQVIYNMSECRGLIDKIKQLSLQICKLVQDSNKVRLTDKQNYLKKRQEFETALVDLEQLRIRFIEDEKFRKSISTTCALVHLHESEQQTKFLDCFEDKNSLNLMANLCNKSPKIVFKGHNIMFTRAPEPSDLNWSNCEIRFSYLRYAFIWAITIIIMYVAFAFVSYVKTIPSVKRSASTLISVIMQVFNRIIWSSLSFLVTLEYNNTKTDSIISLMKKSMFAQVINVVVAPMLDKFLNDIELYGENSVSSNALFYQFIMFFMMLIFYVANPAYYLKLTIINCCCLRNKMIRMLSQVVGEIDTIEEIRPVYHYYEGQEFPIAGAYVYMTSAIIHTFFYLHLQPILLLVLIANITGFYYIMKYLLFHRCKIPQLTDIQVFRVATLGVSYAPLFYGVGSFLFICIEEFHSKGIQFINVCELIPSCILVIVWFLLHLNVWQVLQKINQFIYFGLHFEESFAQAADQQPSNQQPNKPKDPTVSQGTIKNYSAPICQRKESYYQNCNVHKLFNFESELRKQVNAETVERTYQLQEFCESMCRKQVASIENLSQQSKIKRSLQADMLLIPVLKLKKQTVCKKVAEYKLSRSPTTHKQREGNNFLKIIDKAAEDENDSNIELVKSPSMNSQTHQQKVDIGLMDGKSGKKRSSSKSDFN